MANLFLISIGNSLDDSNYSIPVIAPNDYTISEVQSAIDCGDIKLNLSDYSSEFVISISPVKPLWCAFIKEDYKCIESVLKEFKAIN